MSTFFSILFLISMVITIIYALILIWSYAQHEPNFATTQITAILAVITVVLFILGTLTSK
ncbi:hypothetical protein [Paucilactobacillus nenjiangensis]|uniref:hypothetical protein n=1 Tax=Paucilactobacillus nenjiangensis TaxID=1296540 RepID=UPI003BB6A882